VPSQTRPIERDTDETMELEESDGLVSTLAECGPKDIDQLPQPTVINNDNITVQDIDTILSCLKLNTAAPARLMHLVNRLVPFAKAIPGTSLAFKNEIITIIFIITSVILGIQCFY